MRIFKFGGASIKDAEGVKNVVKILEREGLESTLVVVSAMGKITNAFEDVVNSYYKQDINLIEKVNFIKEFHQNIYDDLFGKNHPSYTDIERLFKQIQFFLEHNSSTNYNLIYDQIVPYGELLSTTILSNYLTKKGIDNLWLDVRQFIKTDASYRDAKVDWTVTQENISKLSTKRLHITQGFIGRNENNTTTLGREGSDYTAGIFAYCLNAKSVTIWKDVKGVLNADPREFEQTQLLEKLSYKEAIEMAFYGASVIHPKTLKPLENKSIPLYVRSFIDSTARGTCVEKCECIVPKTPCFIVKKKQILVSISAKDFSFMMEDNIGEVFHKLHKHQLKVNLIQNSALSFSVCIEDKFRTFDTFCKELEQDFKLDINKDLSLFTIRHCTDEAINSIYKKGQVIMEQITEETAQIIVK